MTQPAWVCEANESWWNVWQGRDQLKYLLVWNFDPLLLLVYLRVLWRDKRLEACQNRCFGETLS